MLKDSDYKQFNSLLDRKTNHLEGVNFIRYIGVDYKKKCSVICKYKENDDFIHPFSNVQCSSTSCYYGLDPSFSTNNIITSISNQAFFDEDSFNTFLLNNKEFFSMHRNQQKYIDAVFAKVMLRMATRFGIIFYCEDQVFFDLKIIFNEHAHLFIEEVTIKYIIDEKKGSKGIVFLGGLMSSIIEILDKSKFAWQYDDNSQGLIIVYKKLGKGRLFKEVYKLFNYVMPPDIIKMCYGSVYYSGVLPRVLHISKENSYSNPDVQTLKLLVERTTFATLDAFDNCSILKHPLLKQYYYCLSDFESMEDEAQENLFSNPSLKSNDDMIASINDYLGASFNTHTVAVSGNIVDSEGNLIIAERDRTSIDGGTYYCSVNGQSEFADANVAFYHESVYEDYPSLKADVSCRNDFGKELDRETVAELNIDRLSRNWEYYGISILGIHNTVKYPENSRRMHFNVLAYNQSVEPFESMLLKFESATEKFENNKVEGLKIWFYENVMDRMFHSFTIGISFLSEYSSIISYFLGFFYLILMGQAKIMIIEDTLELQKTVITYLLAVVVFINGIVQLVKKANRYFKLKPYISTYKYLKTKELIPGLEKWLGNFTKKKHYHPILIVMLSLFIIDKMDSS